MIFQKRKEWPTESTGREKVIATVFFDSEQSLKL